MSMLCCLQSNWQRTQSPTFGMVGDDELAPPFLRVADRATQTHFTNVHLSEHAKTERNGFVDVLSVSGLRALCEQILKDHLMMDKNNSVGDLEACMSIALYMYNRHIPAHQSWASPVAPSVAGPQENRYRGQGGQAPRYH